MSAESELKCAGLGCKVGVCFLASQINNQLDSGAFDPSTFREGEADPTTVVPGLESYMGRIDRERTNCEMPSELAEAYGRLETLLEGLRGDVA